MHNKISKHTRPITNKIKTTGTLMADTDVHVWKQPHCFHALFFYTVSLYCFLAWVKTSSPNF